MTHIVILQNLFTVKDCLKKIYNGILKNAQGSSKNVRFESEHNFRLCFVKLKLLLLAIEVKPDDGTDSKVLQVIWKLKKCRVTDICVKREREGGWSFRDSLSVCKEVQWAK